MRGVWPALGLIGFLVTLAGMQQRARLTFPEYDKLPEYYWAGEFEKPADCERAVVKETPNLSVGARCAYARRD